MISLIDEIHQLGKKYGLSLQEEEHRVQKWEDPFQTFSKLFFEYAQGLSEPQQEKIKKVILLVVYYAITSDRLLDKQIPWTKALHFFLPLVKEEVLLIIQSEISTDSAFWEHYRLYQRQFIESSLEESQNHFKKIQAYSVEEFERISAGKAALAKVVTLGVFMTNQDMALVQALEKSIDYFYIGHQCRDDISDWKEDLQEERYSYLLTQVLLEKNPSHNDVQTLNKLMYVEGYVEKMYDLALHYYQAAVDVLKPWGKTPWTEAVIENIQDTQDQKATVENFRMVKTQSVNH